MILSCLEAKNAAALHYILISFGNLISSNLKLAVSSIFPIILYIYHYNYIFDLYFLLVGKHLLLVFWVNIFFSISTLL
jgi:hypothetical protein